MKALLLFSFILFNLNSFAQHCYCRQTYEQTKPVYFREGPNTPSGIPKPEVRTFKLPEHIVADSKGNIFVSRTVGYISGDKLIKITPEGTAGDFIGYMIKNPFSMQEKNTGKINGMCIDANDNIYIAGFDNAGTVKKISPDGSLTRIAGAPERDQGSKPGDYSVKDGKGTDARFYDPQCIAIDNRSGNLFVVDGGRYNWDKAEKKHGFVIRRVTPDGTVTTLRADSGMLRFMDNVKGIAVDNEGNILLAFPGAGCIKKIDANGNITLFAGQCRSGKKEKAPGGLSSFALNDPQHIIVARNGDVWFTEGYFNRIVKISGNKMEVAAGFDKKLAAHSVGAYEGYRDGPVKQAVFNIPMGIAFDAAGNLYIADSYNHCIRKLDTKGMVSTVFN